MLRINIFSKSYKDKEILNDLKMHISNGEFVSLVGPSGCGKTSLLNIISGIDENYSGEILLNEKEIDDEIGFMFQDSRLLPWLSVKQNLLLVLKDKTEENLIDELLEEVNLLEYKDSYPSELSGGMKRKVALCRAFINNPKLILLDEPFISLDYPTAQELRALFMKFYEKYKPTVLLVTHDLTEAVSLSQRVVFFTKKPTKVMLDYKQKDSFVSFDEANIEAVKNDILNRFPNILSGKLSHI